MRPKVWFGVLLVSALISSLALTAPSWGQPFLLDGTHWTNISYDAKVTYIKGVGNMADLEVQSDGPRDSRGYCIAYMLLQEFKDRTIDSVVKEIDAYYQKNPQDLKKPVLEVMIRHASQLCPPAKK